MSFQDRHYRGQPGQYGPPGGGAGGLRFGLPKPTRVVKYLLIINTVIFVIQLIFRNQAQSGRADFSIEQWFAAVSWHPWEIWRLVTFQFLHGDTFHLLFNMIGLYFLGSFLERQWGGRRLLVFYLSCGAVGGAFFLVASKISPFFGDVLIGASGGVLGLLVAAAILFPGMLVIMILFPVPIRAAAAIFTAIYVFSVLDKASVNRGGNLCHLGGMATGLIWVLAVPYIRRWRIQRGSGTYLKKQQNQLKEDYEIDRVLAKVHDHGIHSLTGPERRMLQKATARQKKAPGR